MIKKTFFMGIFSLWGSAAFCHSLYQRLDSPAFMKTMAAVVNIANQAVAYAREEMHGIAPQDDGPINNSFDRTSLLRVRKLLVASHDDFKFDDNRFGWPTACNGLEGHSGNIETLSSGIVLVFVDGCPTEIICPLGTFGVLNSCSFLDKRPAHPAWWNVQARLMRDLAGTMIERSDRAYFIAQGQYCPGVCKFAVSAYQHLSLPTAEIIKRECPAAARYEWLASDLNALWRSVVDRLKMASDPNDPCFITEPAILTYFSNRELAELESRTPSNVRSFAAPSSAQTVFSRRLAAISHTPEQREAAEQRRQAYRFYLSVRGEINERVARQVRQQEERRSLRSTLRRYRQQALWPYAPRR